MPVRAPASPPRPVPHPLPRPAEPGALPRPLAGNRRLLFATLVAVGVTLAGLTVAWSVLVGSIIGRLSDPAPTPGAAVAATAAQLCALALVTATLVGLERVLAEQLGQRWVNEVRVTVFEHLARTPSATTAAPPGARRCGSSAT